MLIRELEQNTGLERATIRYYEKEGFITPHREENGYRTYSEEDRDTLLKIKLLRQLGMPLEMIRGLQQGSEDFQTALNDQINALEHKIQDAGRAKEVCVELRDTGAAYEDLDAAHYLKELAKARPAEPAWNPQPVPEFRWPVVAYPWKRYFAREIDQMVFRIALLFLGVVILRIRPLKWFYAFLNFYLVTALLWVPVEGLLIHYFGTTPGKWLLGIHIESVNGGPMPISDAIHRAWDVLRYGYGFDIPLYTLWRQYCCYRDYKDYGYVQWDREHGAEYQFSYYFSTGKKVGMAVMVALHLIAVFVTINDSIKPFYRGEDLTVAQFASNYNQILNEAEGSYSYISYLQEDGTWPKFFEGNGVSIYIDGRPVIVHDSGRQETGYSDFEYELENGVIRTITYNQTWTEVSYLSPLSGKAVNALISIATAQDWFNLISYSDFTDKLNTTIRTDESGSFVYRNLEIQWDITAVNCRLQNGIFVKTSDINAVPTVELDFRIIIHEAS